MFFKARKKDFAKKSIKVYKNATNVTKITNKKLAG